MNTTSEKVKGTFNEAAGKSKEMAGKVLGNDKLQLDGSKQKIDGQIGQKEAQAKELLRKGLNTTGDLIEKVGDKIEHAGFKKIGDAVEKLGNKIEHLAD